MHGRQHTGVSIYEARTETGEKDERSGRSDDSGEAATETADNDGEREKERENSREAERKGKSKRDRKEDSTRVDVAERENPDAREQPRARGLSRPLPIISVPKPVSSTSRRRSLSP